MDFFETKTGLLLRWIFFFPISILFSSLASVLGMLFELVREFLGIANEGEFALMVAPAVGSYVFFYSIWNIVPNYKIQIVYTFFVISAIIRVIDIMFYDENSDNLLSIGMTIFLTGYLILQTLIQIDSLKTKEE